MTGESKQLETMMLVSCFQQQRIQQKGWSCGKVGQVKRDCPGPMEESNAVDSKSKAELQFLLWAG